MAEWVLKSFDELKPSEIYEILQLRMKTFIVEQKRSYLEIDGNDPKTLHFFKREGGIIIAYSRILPPGVTFSNSSIGRIVVRKESRGTGLGRELVKRSIEIAKKEWNTTMEISAQLHLEKFYNSFGFKTISDIYDKEGVPHVNMILD
ncbi:MAG: GNAT family N-acetyltransferase [Defluviitaleaceae bacterium]|nr:GNAT family N-acetyltransferase [Defluviitaleaceae bacterium]